MPDAAPGGTVSGVPLPPPIVGRRLAAAGALLALLAAVVTVLTFLRDPLATALALVLVVVAVVAGWDALVHRGGRRILAAATAGAALLVALAVLLVTGSVLRLVTVLVLAAVATAAARAAIGRDLAPVPVSSTAVGPAGAGVLIVNPRSGGGKADRYGLVGLASSRGVRPVVLEPGDDLRALAEEAVAGGADVIGMAGGDGSQALVADVARRHDVAHVCVPAGTRNHFALDLGLDRDDVVAALDAFGPAVERRVDLALLRNRAGDRVFVNNASLGVYATVVRSGAYRDAKLATTASALPELLGPGAPRPDLRFTGADGVPVHSADVLLVSNGAYRLNRLDGFGTRERVDGGLLGVVTVTVDRARDLPAVRTAEARGRIGLLHGYREWTTREFEVGSAERTLAVALDGEALRLAPPLRFRSLPGALRVRIPVGAPGVAPAARAPAGLWSGVTALMRVLGGRPAR
ncbi:diacylglycerol kinase family protein [Pseudonocardia nematodicida]|uniref:Diacylglycerol kinase family protein n=1 Tax=Pseudonocardia nematodicida TaxID=1206997 RepID=A0ABV1KB81_9PSEU